VEEGKKVLEKGVNWLGILPYFGGPRQLPKGGLPFNWEALFD